MAYGKNARRCGALVACALLAAGCGGQAASSSVSRSLPQEEPVSGSLTVYLEQSFADDTLVNYPIRQAIDAFVGQDEKKAREVAAYDDVVDDYFSRIRKKLILSIRDPQHDAEYAMDLLMIAKYFERIGDHAVNIAGWVIFSITGSREE